MSERQRRGGAPGGARIIVFPPRRFLLAVAESRAAAAALEKRLLALRPVRQKVAAARGGVFTSWGLAERLCELSERTARRDPEEAERLSLLAGEIAWRLYELPPAWMKPHHALQLGALAMAHSGNALRVAEQLEEADRAFLTAFHAMRGLRGRKDQLAYYPRMMELFASLRRAQRRLPIAIKILERLAGHYRRSEPERALRAYLKLAKAHEEQQCYAQALETLERAAPLLEEAGDWILERVLRHNTAWTLTFLERHTEALLLILELRRDPVYVAAEPDALRLDWTEARARAGLGQAAVAEELYAGAQRGFQALGLAFDAALVALERACVAFDRGDPETAARCASEVVPVFEAKGIHREALAALKLYAEACRDGRADRDSARRLLAFLSAARHGPGSRFRPTS